MNNTKRKKLSGRVTFFLFTLIPVVLYTFLRGICNQWYSIQFYRLGWNGSENEFYRVEEL